MASNVIITMRHVRKAGQCSRGARAFAQEHNLDWDDFLKNGISLEKMRAIDDAIGNKIADIAEAEATEATEEEQT